MVYVIIVVIAGTVYYLYVEADKNPSKNPNKEVKEFIERANDRYILAHSNDDPSAFIKYANEDVIMNLEEQISYGSKLMFGLERYRERTIEIIEDLGYSLVVRIKISHKSIKVNKSISIAVGDDVTMIWKLRRDSGAYQVVDIM